MTILIFGASGQVGDAAAASVVMAGQAGSLRLITHRAEGVDDLRTLYPGAEVVVADYLDPETLRTAFAGIDRIMMNVPDFMPEPDATRNVVTAALACDPVPFVLRFGAYPPGKVLDDLTPATRELGVGAGKHLKSIPVLKASGVPHAVLNAPAWFMSNLTWMAAQGIRERGEMVIPVPRETPFIAPEDCGAAAAAILLDDSRCLNGAEYTIQGPEWLTFDDVAAKLTEILGKPVSYNDDTDIFRSYFGDMSDTLIEFFTESLVDYEGCTFKNDLPALLKREPTTLATWLEDNQGAFKT